MSTSSDSSRSLDERLRHWEAHGERLCVAMRAVGGEHGQAIVYRRTLTDSRRAARALVALGVCWALAAATALIPLAHFVLVPVFAIAGPIAAWVRYREASVVLGGRGPCPVCGEDVIVGEQSESWPLWASCDACGARLDAELR